MLDKGLLHVAAVVQCQFIRQCLGQVLRVGGAFAAVRVIVLQASC